MSPRRPPTPDVLVERLHAGDLSPAEAVRVRARLEAEGGLDRLAALDRDAATFREAHPPGPGLAEIRRRAGLRTGAAPRPRRRWAIPAFTLAAAAAAAALLAVVRAPGLPGPGGAAGEDTRLKGPGPHLQVHRRGPGDVPQPLPDGATARAGDVLQLSCVAAGGAFGVVVSIDGRGTVTLHLPDAPGPAARLEARGAVPLPHAYALDDAPQFERFFLVTSNAPFDAELALAAARRLAASGRADRDPLPVPAPLAQQGFLLVKAPAR
ncbi:MAG: hypothetical protein QM767_19825 [Anaeromyxobacter sp.]